MTNQIALYDTTLRDGNQGEQVNLSAEDKLRIAHKLDEFGIQYVEGGWPGSNPKDARFFEMARKTEFKKTRPSPLHVLNPQFIQLVSDPELVLG